MTVATSPLRYPGGKASLLLATAETIRINNLKHCHYAEPFAGGCGLALALLYGGHVSEIHINDIDRAIWAFWYCVLKKPTELIERIENIEVTIEEWHRQRVIQNQRNDAAILDLGFSTFFLNRTNRSGIIKGAGVIGGLDQSGPYKLDCRYNRGELARRIARVSKYADRIHLYNLDAEKFLKQSNVILPKHSFMFIDPPYFTKGADLYTSFYRSEDHEKLALAIRKLKNPWIVTYDAAEEISALYQTQEQAFFDLRYSVQTKRLGTELLIISKGLKIPALFNSRSVLAA